MEHLRAILSSTYYHLFGFFTCTSHLQPEHYLTPAIPARHCFIGGFVNTDQLLKNVQPDLNNLLILLRNLFGNIPEFLYYYIQATYFDCVQCQYRPNRGDFPPLNTDQEIFICQSLLNNENINGYYFIPQHMYAVIGPAGTRKTNTFIHLICADYASRKENSANAVILDIIRRTWVNDNSGVNQNGMFMTAGRLRTPKILVFVPKYNAVSVIQHKLLQVIPKWRVHPYYQRLDMENQNEMENPLLAETIRLRRETYPAQVTERLSHSITLITLVSSYRSFPRNQNQQL